MAQEYLEAVGCNKAPMIEYNEEVDRESCIAVSVVTSPYVPIETNLLNRGYKVVVPFYDLTECFRHKHPLSNGWFAPHLTLSDRKQVNSVLANWHDDVSRAHHLQFLAWRRLREEWSFDEAPLPVCERFFIPEIVLHEHEYFVDCGAHHGGVSQAFVSHVGGRFDGITAIEPDSTNRAMLEYIVRGEPRIKVLSYALAEHEGIANFHEGLGYASQLSTTGHSYAITMPIDALKLAPTFIKLHLEGAELAALRGAKRTLMAHRPIVAATVYHNEDGMWKTAQWLMHNLSDYRFLFRLHSWCGTGAVIYAIPKER